MPEGRYEPFRSKTAGRWVFAGVLATDVTRNRAFHERALLKGASL